MGATVFSKPESTEDKTLNSNIATQSFYTGIGGDDIGRTIYKILAMKLWKFYFVNNNDDITTTNVWTNLGTISDSNYRPASNVYFVGESFDISGNKIGDTHLFIKADGTVSVYCTGSTKPWSIRVVAVYI